MILVVLFAIGLIVVAFIGAATWQILCWGMRKVLGIPKHPPYYVAPQQHIPEIYEPQPEPPSASQIKMGPLNLADRWPRSQR
jgi:hypothetical protein